MASTAAFRHDLNVPAVYQAFVAAEVAILAAGLPKSLVHLVKLRASQINECGFCVKMHVKEARQDGETNDRLDRLVVWRHVGDFTPAERAALAFTEAVTQLHKHIDMAPLRAELREHFSDQEASALTSAIAMINLWNRLQVSGH
jgi:AhpD family alkylhydroperoxidase